MTYTSLLIVGIGGLSGSVLRWLIGLRLNSIFPELPLGTLTANIIGGYIIGLAAGAVTADLGVSQNMRLFIIPGFCGGFTTFSSFAVHAVTESPWRSILYVLGTLIPAILAAALGKGLGERWIRARDGASA